LMVAIGGYNSCRPGPYKQDMYKPFQEIRKKLAEKKNIKTRFIIGCHGKASGKIHYFTHSNPKELKTGEDVDLLADIEKEAKKTSKKSVYLFGHSHGGWSVMKVAQVLNKKYKIKGLATIDPISKVQCKPSVMAVWWYRLVTNKKTDPACKRAPADFTDKEIKKIKKRSKWWRNYFQQDTNYLHSGPIDQIDFNMLIAFKDYLRNPGIAHSLIDNDIRVWRNISERVMKDFK